MKNILYEKNQSFISEDEQSKFKFEFFIYINFLLNEFKGLLERSKESNYLFKKKGKS